MIFLLIIEKTLAIVQSAESIRIAFDRLPGLEHALEGLGKDAGKTALLLAVGLCCVGLLDVGEGAGGWLGKMGDSLNCRLAIGNCQLRLEQWDPPSLNKAPTLRIRVKSAIGNANRQPPTPGSRPLFLAPLDIISHRLKVASRSAAKVVFATSPGVAKLKIQLSPLTVTNSPQGGL